MPDTKNGLQNNQQSRYEQISADRNRALRLLFDTTISIVNYGVQPCFVARKLLEISNADYCSFAVYNNQTGEIELKAVVESEKDIPQKSRITVLVPPDKYNTLCGTKIENISDNNDYDYLNALLPVEYDPKKNKRYLITCVFENTLLAVYIVQFNTIEGRIKLKDIIEILMNILGIEIKRKINYEDLLLSKQKLSQSEEETRRLFETCGVAMCAVDIDFNITRCNHNFLAMWKITPEQSKTMKCYEICKGDTCESDECFLKKIANSEREEQDVKKYTRDGRELIINIVATPLTSHGKTIGMIEAMHDITERKKIEQEIEQSNKELQITANELKSTQKKLVESTNLSSLSTLSTGIAHEFNNILTIMSGYTEILKTSLTDDSLISIINPMSKVISRAKQITDGLLEFSQNLNTHNKLNADIRTIVDNALMLSNKTLSDAQVQLSKQYSDIPPTFCYSSQLIQVFLNIINNAVEAMTDSLEKKLNIEIELCQNKKRGPCKNPDGCIFITFTDTGKGIDKEEQAKIFEPFYTTKGVLGKGNISKSGTGLSLSISYGIIKRHNGSINVQSQKNKGTEIIISLPIDRQVFVQTND